jgi:hypothetical protein
MSVSGKDRKIRVVQVFRIQDQHDVYFKLQLSLNQCEC